LMFGCGDTVRKLVKDVRVRATERLKNAKKVGATARLSQAPVSRFRYPCVFDLAGRVGVHLAWLCLMQAPGTGARKETLSPVRYGSLNRSSNVRSRHSLFGTSWSGCPTVDFAVVPNHRRRGRCAHVDEGNPGKTVKAEGAEGSVPQEPCKTHPLWMRMHKSRRHLNTATKSTTIHGSDIQTTAGRWLGKYTSSYCPCCMQSWSCACLVRELFVVMIMNGSVDF
jgi:hypothetical protein